MEKNSKTNILILLWKNIPKWYKNFFWTVLGLSVIKFSLGKILNDEIFIITKGFVYTLYAIATSIVLGFFIGLLRIISQLYNYTIIGQRDAKILGIDHSSKKLLPNYFNLEQVSIDNVEFSIKAFRCFRVDDNPGVEKFLNSIKILPLTCNKCKNDLSYVEDSYSRRTSMYVWACNNKICDNYFKFEFSKRQFDELVGQLMLQTKTKIRTNFDRYWKKYCEIYKGHTGGNFDDYEGIYPLDSMQYYEY